MPTATRICKVCGKEYEYCHTLRRIEGSIYLAEIEASRADDAEPVVPLNEPTPSSSDYSDLDECDGEDSWFEDDFDEEEDTE